MSWLFYTFIFFVGLIFGSFLNACLWRSRQGLSIWFGRSMCTHCRQKIKWFDNFPVVSFFVLRAKCRSCKKHISWQYPAVELWLGLVYLAVALVVGENFSWAIFVRDAVIIWFLTAIFWYDLAYQEILDRYSLWPAIVLFIFSLVFGWRSASDMLLGVVVAGGFFALQYLISRGRWIGGGDIRLGVFMGVILGWPLAIVALGLAYLVGAGVSLILLLLKKVERNSAIPFGTFLSLATLFAMFWGEKFLFWYLNLI